MFRDYKVEVANTVDLQTYARHCLMETASGALADMAFSPIGKTLRKDPAIRLSNWSSRRLTPVQARKMLTGFIDRVGRRYLCSNASA